jgi:hypothetical protein
VRRWHCAGGDAPTLNKTSHEIDVNVGPTTAQVCTIVERYLRDRPVDTGPEFSFFRDWVPYSGIATPAYGTSATYPGGSAQQLYLSGADQLVTSRSAVEAGSATYANPPGEAPLSYSEVSALQGDPVPNDEMAPYDAPGSFAAWSTAPLAAPPSTRSARRT